MAWIEGVFERYGYFVLLFGLPLDFIALPLPPGQTTLAYTGYLAYKGTLALPAALASALFGTLLGVTTTYTIGFRLGAPALAKIGRRLGVTDALLARTRRIFDKYGTKALFLSFFIPGVRQVAGYFAGTLRLPFRLFAAYAYSGAIVWVAAFVMIGYAFGEQWQAIFAVVEKSLKYIAIGIAAFILAILLVRLGLSRRNKAES
ncbi:DedA family protein [Paenibacillus sp. TRM 82003]|nr:DedA family protein [Paenibacillus sp. TRM 82003]